MIARGGIVKSPSSESARIYGDYIIPAHAKNHRELLDRINAGLLDLEPQEQDSEEQELDKP